MFKTRITDLFGVDFPIVQGGLMWVANSQLTSAVANAGAMGFMTALSYPTADKLRDDIRRCRDLTDKPFGINLTFLPSLRTIDYQSYLEVCAAEGILFIETAGRSPEPYMAQLKDCGIKVIHKCTSIRHAIKAQSIGCDAVSIDGYECAGHPGEDDVTSLILIPLAVDALGIPVIASGGFADGRGLAAALALGAEGINMGTRFVATKEAPVHQAFKEALVSHNETDTRLIMRTLKNTERVLATKTVDKILELEALGAATIKDLAPYVSGLTGKSEVLEKGNIEAGAMAVGQSIGLIKDIPGVVELVNRIVKDAEQILFNRSFA